MWRSEPKSHTLYYMLGSEKRDVLTFHCHSSGADLLQKIGKLFKCGGNREIWYAYVNKGQEA